MGDLPVFDPFGKTASCGRGVFNLRRNARVIFSPRLNPREIGDRAALIIGPFPCRTFFKGQLIIPHLGFHGREKKEKKAPMCH